MSLSNKKYLYYGGGALLVGAVAFFVYSFFKKDKFVVGNTAVLLNDENEINLENDSKNYFQSANQDLGSIGFSPTPLSELWNKLK